MSFILDALKRAERERTVGQAPGAGEIAQSSAAAPARRNWLLPVVIAVLVANALLAGWLLLNRTAPATPGASLAAAPATPLPPPPLPATTPSEAPAIEDGGTLSSLDDLGAQTDESEIEGEAEEDAEEQAASAAPAPAKPRPRPRAAPATPATQTAAEEENVMEDEAPVEVHPEAPPAAAVSAAAPVPSSSAATALREMPSSYQANFPALNLEVHAHDAQPERRFILISGKRYREGQNLAEGPRVIEIVADGVVLEHAGQQVLYPLPRR